MKITFKFYQLIDEVYRYQLVGTPYPEYRCGWISDAFTADTPAVETEFFLKGPANTVTLSPKGNRLGAALFFARIEPHYFSNNMNWKLSVVRAALKERPLLDAADTAAFTGLSLESVREVWDDREYKPSAELLAKWEVAKEALGNPAGTSFRSDMTTLTLQNWMDPKEQAKRARLEEARKTADKYWRFGLLGKVEETLDPVNPWSSGEVLYCERGQERKCFLAHNPGAKIYDDTPEPVPTIHIAADVRAKLEALNTLLGPARACAAMNDVLRKCLGELADRVGGAPEPPAATPKTPPSPDLH